jgi:hypothetical protein
MTCFTYLGGGYGNTMYNWTGLSFSVERRVEAVPFQLQSRL